MLACLPAEEDSGLPELERTIAAFYEAVESGDKESHAQMFSDSAFMMPNNGALISGGESIGEVVRGLNAIGVSPRDLIAILQAIKAAGALQSDAAALRCVCR